MAEKKPYVHKEQDNVELIRVLGKDLRGDNRISVGLTKIKGISWAISSAICRILKINQTTQIRDITPEQLKQIEEFMKNVQLPSFMMNRQKDNESGKDMHVSGADLTLRQEFDIKRLRKIKTYRGIRHGNKLPVRGQRTKSNFRPNKKKSGRK
ncbi:MAG: small subunit ribosomal protein S13 [Patescibacteria group bacterium]|jgi:small subunit ribosomal protein S13